MLLARSPSRPDGWLKIAQVFNGSTKAQLNQSAGPMFGQGFWTPDIERPVIFRRASFMATGGFDPGTGMCDLTLSRSREYGNYGLMDYGLNETEAEAGLRGRDRYYG